MITGSGYNVRIWQDTINGLPTLSIDEIEIELTNAEREELIAMLNNVYVDEKA